MHDSIVFRVLLPPEILWGCGGFHGGKLEKVTKVGRGSFENSPLKKWQFGQGDFRRLTTLLGEMVHSSIVSRVLGLRLENEIRSAVRVLASFKKMTFTSGLCDFGQFWPVSVLKLARTFQNGSPARV